MLKRIATAAVLLAFLLPALLYLSAGWLAVVFGLVTLVGAWEWTALIPLKRLPFRIIFVAAVCAVMAFVYYVYAVMGAVYHLNAENEPVPITYVMTFALCWWAFVFITLVITVKTGREFFNSRTLKVLSCFFTLIPAWLALWYLRLLDQATHLIHGIHTVNAFLLVQLFAVVIIADAAAYFAGRAWGKTKLAPTLSPGKTWEGVAGALVTVALLSFVLGYTELIPLFLIVVVFSIVGDLYESKLKRLVGVKDSGNIFPGHGGVLDRIDALVAAAPVFLLMRMALGVPT